MKRRIVSLLMALCMLGLLATGVYAWSTEPQLPHVTDQAGLLTEIQIQRLEKMAQTLAEQYDVGIYIVTVEDYRDFDPTGVYEAAYGIYHGYSLGEGRQRNGMILLLSMEERDYALFRYGEKAVYAFDDYGLEKLEAAFLDDFGDDSWNDGFQDYVRTCGQYLEKAAAGNPVRKSPVTLILISWAIALVIAAVVCAGLVGQMKTVRKSTGAVGYAGNLVLTERFDQFTHRTQTQRKIERSQSAGGESHSGGSSGKF